MKFVRCYLVSVLVAALGLALAAPALAVSTAGPPGSVSYVAAFTPEFGYSGIPYAGTMRLLMHDDGAVTGTYEGISTRPDRFNNHISAVIGAISQDGTLHLVIGNALAFNGELSGDGSISGTATYYGRLYEFLAKPGTPGGAH
jgi:hypothetical protein